VLLIISDDLRDTIHCYGNDRVKTPNVDGLAAAECVLIMRMCSTWSVIRAAFRSAQCFAAVDCAPDPDRHSY